MKTPITYYGGKQLITAEILPLIPPHKVYIEPFFGGGAIFFAKPVSELEVINDINDRVINFYRVLKIDFDNLQKLVLASLHSRKLHKQAYFIYNKPEMHSDLLNAWAFWVVTNMGFKSKIGSSWGCDKTKNKHAKALFNKRKAFNMDLAQRVEQVQIECNDALKVIRTYDSEKSFFYIDPPYFNSNMGHYDGYTESDFRALLELLAKLKGRFLLSSYPSQALNDFTLNNGWSFKSFNKNTAVSKKATGIKTEVLTWNYTIY